MFRRFSVFVGIIFLTFAGALPAKPVFIANSKIPSGFESLNRPQRSLVDIYYGGRYITSQVATFTFETIKLPAPKDVVGRIRDVTDPELITRLLSGEILGNSQEVCAPRQTRGCGRLSPEVVGVIFDENRFRLDVFINRNYLTTRQADVERFLPPSDGGFAFLQNFSATASGNTSSSRGNNNSDYTVNGVSLLSWKENSLYGSWDYTKNQKLTVDRLYGQREFEGVAWQGGMLSSRGFGLSFTSDQTLLGGRIATSDNTRLDTGFTGGVPLDVFLPTRGRVELRKDGKLLTSQFFEAGNQELNTSSLPDGAYDLEVRIVDDLGNQVSKETRFFAKQNRLPASGEWDWFVESGNILNRTANKTLPETTGQWLSRAGVGRRLGDTWSGTLALAADNDEALLETGLFHVGSFYDLSPYAMVDDDGNHGFGVDARTRAWDISLNGNYRRLWSNAPASTSDNNDNNLLGESFEQISSSVSLPFYTGSVSYRYSYNKRQNDATESHGINWRGQLWRTNDYDLDFDLGLSKSGDNEVILATLNFRLRQDRWDFRASPSAEWSKTGNNKDRDERLQLTTSWNDDDLYDADVRFDAGISKGSDQDRFNTNLRYANHLGAANLALAHTRAGDSRATSYSLNMGTSLMVNSDYVSVGGEDRAQSAVVVYIEGRDGDRFDVIVDGRRETYAVVGQPTLIPLTPYEQYRISLKPAGTAMYRFDEKIQEVTLYPGNVVRMEVEALPLRLAFGRILFTGFGETGGRITGGMAPVTLDEYGLFQLEIQANTPELRVELDNGWACRIQLPKDSGEDILRLGTVKLSETDCQPWLDGELAISQTE